jgi:prophage regulatory protein
MTQSVSVRALEHGLGKPFGTTNCATRILREPQVKARTGLSRTTRWRLEREGKFPTRIKLSANAVGWIEQDIETWIQRLASQRAEVPSTKAIGPV